VSEERNRSSVDVDSIDTSILLDIDVSSTSALPIDTLEKISWDLVATDTLGIMDPIGQLRAWLESLLTGFIDTIKKAFEAITSPIKSVVDSIWSTLSTIPSVLSNIIDTLRSVVVRPIQDALNWVSTNFPAVVDAIRTAITIVYRFLSELPARVSEFIDSVKKFFGDLADRIRSGFSWFLEQVVKLPDFVKGLIDTVSRLFGELVDKVRSGFSWFIEQITKIPDMIKGFIDTVSRVFGDLADRIRSGFAWFLEQLGRIPDVVRGLADTLSRVFGELADRIRGGFSWLVEQVVKLPDMIRNFIDTVIRVFGELADRVRSGFAWFIEQVVKLPDMIRNFIDTVIRVFGDLADRVRSGFTWLLEQADMARSLIERIINLLRDLAERVQSAFSWFIGQVVNLPAVVDSVVTGIVGKVAEGVGGFVERVQSGFESIRKTLGEWFNSAKMWFEEATKALQATRTALEVGFQGFVNAVVDLPKKVEKIFSSIIKFFEELWNFIQNFIKDRVEWFRKNFVEPLWSALVLLGEKIFDGLKTLWQCIVSGLSWLWDMLSKIAEFISGKIVDTAKLIVSLVMKTMEVVVSWFKSLIVQIFMPIIETAKTAEGIFERAMKRTTGVAENLWRLAGELVRPYWELTLVPIMLRGLVRTFGDSDLVIEPEIFGNRVIGMYIKVKLSEIADALVRGLETYFSGYAIGVSMAVANMFMVNIQQLYVPRVVQYYDAKIREYLGDILKEELEAGAEVNMFMKPVPEDMLIDYSRRMLALAEGLKNVKVLNRMLSTIRAHLKIYGLPMWYINFLTKHPEELAIRFVDRFGVKRMIFLSHIFELPTHSEMARMTQRDIFPGVDVMKKMGWVRGWNEDLTTMIYLLTFKYPSFEKLWSFYMRALSGMLWFKTPEVIKAVFDREAEEVGAGKPISPLDLQKALAGPDQVKAFETALNVYFKWLEYSNFSWFTEKTEMYNIKIGQEVVSKLGGWTADSWLMVDIAADIPSKIDMRWMSRYGIFQLMAERFENMGVRFESYAPLVEVVPKLMDSTAQSQVQIDLTWFSKLLQATGLHPAWVPVVTVAENIMAISDEMTLLRTGWLNFFKEGMLTVEDVEKYLAGLITVSYRVGFWDPEKKVWTSGWINLPVRWLPHERRLLELRMAMDRIMDIYREVYSYIRSGIRTLAISAEQAKEKLQKLVAVLNKHYSTLAKAVTGVEMELKLDTSYAELWLVLQELAQDIEARERARVWWSRVSGWLLYRIAYGWVKEEELGKLIETVAKHIPLHEDEVKAYIEIAKAVLGIARKESIPSPSTLATFAEYMVIDTSTIKKVLEEYNVPLEYHDLWIKYISVKPLKTDYRTVITTALRALRYGAIPEELWKKILEDAKKFGFTDPEILLIQMRADLELMIEEAREYVPTLSMLATMAEHLPEVRGYIKSVLEARRVRGVWAELWTKYIYLRPVVDEARRWAGAVFGLAERAIISVEQLKPVYSILMTYGWEELEIEIAEKTILANIARRAWTELLGTARQLTTMSRYSPIATDLAWIRVSKLVDLLPVDDSTKRLIKEMWKTYIVHYQNYPEIRSYISELVSAYAYGVIDDKTLDRELSMLKTLGVPETTLSLVKRRAQLRKARHALR